MSGELRAVREAAGFSQAQAAERAGVSVRTLRRWETGHGFEESGHGLVENRTFADLRRLAGVYGCRLSELLERNQYPSLPLDPAARREAVIRRNALIAGVDPGEALAGIEAARAARFAERDRRVES